MLNEQGGDKPKAEDAPVAEPSEAPEALLEPPAPEELLSRPEPLEHNPEPAQNDFGSGQEPEHK
jgi:hypothetical protein